MSKDKKPFLTAERPHLDFWHRFLRVLLGVAMLVISIFQLWYTLGLFGILIFSNVGFMDNNSGQSHSDGFAYALFGIIIFALGNIAWIVASLVLIFKPLYRNSGQATLCTLAAIVSLVAFYIVFHSSPTSNGILILIAALIYAGLAVGAISFSRWSSPAFRYRFRNNSTDSAQGSTVITRD